MSDSESKSSPSSARRFLWLIAALAIVYGLYEGVRWGIRRHVDSRIEESVGKALVDFELLSLTGEMYRSKDLRGRTVVLNFFRSHCSMCRTEAPVMRELARRANAESVAVLAVMMDRVQGFSEAETAATLAEFRFEHPVLMADEAFVDTFHGVGWSHVTPVTYIIDPSGQVAHSLRGHRDFDELEAVLPPGSIRP